MTTTKYTRHSAQVLLEAAALQERKANDYQNPLSRVRQADHYPRGVNTILDIVHGKVLRMQSVLETMEQGGKINFESVEDSAVDAINYLSFLVAYMRGEMEGQQFGRDVFNRPVTALKSGEVPDDRLIPSKFRTGIDTITVGIDKPEETVYDTLARSTKHPVKADIFTKGPLK